MDWPDVPAPDIGDGGLRGFCDSMNDLLRSWLCPFGVAGDDVHTFTGKLAGAVHEAAWSIIRPAARDAWQAGVAHERMRVAVLAADVDAVFIVDTREADRDYAHSWTAFHSVPFAALLNADCAAACDPAEPDLCECEARS